MPTIDISELNITIAVLGTFTILYGLASVKMKQVWYLGEALPALLVGIILGPMAAKFIDSEKWGSAVPYQTQYITLSVTRVVIGVHLVSAGYQLPAKYPWHRWRDMAIVLLPAMAIMWLCTTGCIKLMIPKTTTLSAMAIASMVTCSDPVLSQAIAKGPFADKYVPRALREIMSAESGANDGFGFPYLLIATYLIRHAPDEDVHFKPGLAVRAADVGRLGGGAGQAIQNWLVEGWLYFILLGAVFGTLLGIASMYAVTFTLKRKWIDTESLLLYPTALGLFTIGVCGFAGLNDLLACFCAGVAMNWNGNYLNETLARNDEINSSIDAILNIGGFMYIGTVLPWSEFSSEVTGITYGRLIVLGILLLLLRRIPAILAVYKAMPNSIKSWQEALFMGYFGPIGIGAIFYVEHARHLFPYLDKVETYEEEDLLRAMVPTVYFLVLFSMVVQGLSIPALDLIYRWRGVEPIMELEPATRPVRSTTEALLPNSHLNLRSGSVVRHNRFSQSVMVLQGMDDVEAGWSTRSRHASVAGPLSTRVSMVPKGRRPSATPVWRLGGGDVGSAYSLNNMKDDGHKDVPRVQIVEEKEIVEESEPSGIKVGSPTTSFPVRRSMNLTVPFSGKNE